MDRGNYTTSKKQFYSEQYTPKTCQNIKRRRTERATDLVSNCSCTCIASFNRQLVLPLSMHAADGNLGEEIRSEEGPV